MEDTVFAKIIRGEIPATKVYDDDLCIAILDVQPVNLGHTLIIPKESYRNIYELPVHLTEHLFVVAKKIAEALKQSLDAEGVNIIMNNDSAAGQLVFHAHIHVIPRYAGDGFRHWHGERGYAPGEAEQLGAKLKNSLH